MTYSFINHLLDFLPFEALFLPEALEDFPVLLLPRTFPVPFFFSCHSKYFLNWFMVIWSVVLVDFFPPGDGMAGVCFLLTGLLAETFPFWGVLPFFSADLLGVYLRILSTLLPTSPVASGADFLPAFAFDLEAAFFFPLAPPLTLGAAWEAWS